MKTLVSAVCVSMLALAALPAQEEGHDKPVKQEKQDKQDQKDQKAQEKITANDPAIRAIDQFIKKQSVDTKKDGWRLTLAEPPKQEFVPDNDYLWHVETEVGSMTIRYFTDAAPMHVTSGIYLSRLGYYDGLNFHRIIPGFMAQGGCPTGTGTGGPGFFMEGEFKGKLSHDKAGLLSMANTGRPKSEGSQFFITFGPTQQLDGKYTLWGQVIEGTETLKALEKLGRSANNGMLDNGPKIVKTWITVVPKKAKEAKKDGDDKEGKGEKGEHGGR